jgi:hypothetical protein
LTGSYAKILGEGQEGRGPSITGKKVFNQTIYRSLMGDGMSNKVEPMEKPRPARSAVIRDVLKPPSLKDGSPV